MSYSEDTKISGKKSRMRTASDVISRLLWDETLPKSDFNVGYLDRFLGIIEKPFTALDWSDPSTVDNNTLALPKHRIQYFKYKHQMVWDKRTRLDMMFGSTGIEADIQKTLADIDKTEENIFLTDINEDGDTIDEIANKVAYDNSDRPNFFVAARIQDEETLTNLDDLAREIESKDSTLLGCCITKNEFHMTLATLRLDSPEEVVDAIVALNDLKMQLLQIPVICLEGLGIFHRRVLYARVGFCEKLNEFRKQVISSLTDWKVKLLDKEVFVPHVTIVKTSRPAARKRHSKFIDPGLYINHLIKYFGPQKINKLYLCEMGEARSDDGFYKYVTEVEL